MSLGGVACYYEAGGLTQQQAGIALGRTCQVLWCSQRADVNVGRDSQEVAGPSFPGVLKTLWYHESSQIYQPLISLREGDVK